MALHSGRLMVSSHRPDALGFQPRATAYSEYPRAVVYSEHPRVSPYLEHPTEAAFHLVAQQLGVCLAKRTRRADR